VKERLAELRERLLAAWPAARAVAGDPDLRTKWLKSARAAQITLLCVILAGVSVVPLVVDAAADTVLPPKTRRVWFRRRVQRHPGARVLSVLVKTTYWIGGLGTSAALLVLHAPLVVGRRREEVSALAETMEVSGGPPIDPLAATMSPDAGDDAGQDAPPPDRYRILGELGSGGMGVVFRAEDQTLGREVALKRLRAGRMDAAAAERFRREARVLAQLKHPGVVEVYDLAEGQGGLWMAMELVEGGALDALIAERGRLPLDRAAALGATLAETLAHAHDQDVVHRDFKPGNVLLTNGGEPKITDFGLAKLQQEGAKLTQLGAVLGSPGYMSPEQASGSGVDHRTDVYALGVTIFEMLTGRCPFEGDTAQVLAAHITQAPPAIADLGVEIPPEIDALLRRMLAKSPDERPEDLRAVAAELRQLAAGVVAAG
jgi:hypothetical protein